MSPTSVRDRTPSVVMVGESGMPSPRPGSARSSINSAIDRTTMQHINIAVLGADKVGKSTFIQKSLELRAKPSSATASRKMAIDGCVYVVRLIELEFDDLYIEEDELVRWPDTVDDMATPRIDGTLILYDVMNKDSLTQVPEMLNAMHQAPLPCILVSTKCDNHPAHREVDPSEIERRAKSFIDNVIARQTNEADPDTGKRCIFLLLRNIVSGKVAGPRSSATSRRRANSSAVRNVSPKPHPAQKHGRASSEYSSSRLRGSANAYDSDSPGGGQHQQQKRTVGAGSGAGSGGTKAQPHHQQQQKRRSKAASQLSSTPQQSFLDLDESPGYDDSVESDASSDQGARSIRSEMPSSDANGYSFEQLVDRLLAQPLSKQDSKFASIFLALYRKFAPPGRLLDAIIRRFEALERDGRSVGILKKGEQCRHLQILEQWVGNHPGDFANPATRKRMLAFATRLAAVPLFAVGAGMILADLEVVVEDDDAVWGCCDRDDDKSAAAAGAGKTAFSNATTALDEKTDDDEDDSRLSNARAEADMAKHMSSVTISSEGSTAPLLPQSNAAAHLASTTTLHATPTNPTTTTPRSPSGSTAHSSSSSQTLLNYVEGAQRQSKNLVPTMRNPLSKVQWHLLIAEPEEHVARELTRMDWLMFSSIRPRDLVRHVSLNADRKRDERSLEHVNRMIEHFNHLADWVANFVLLRDKPKHRAMMLEKFMKIARKLREMNNYNSLGAILAGINGTAVHRLLATRDLITPQVARDFLKLEILMGTQKSHFAYRLAWENSPGERIPYLPLLRRDLVSALEGNKTFMDDGHEGEPGEGYLVRGKDGRDIKRRINWRKFEIMGEVIVGVQRAQGVPYVGMQRNDDIKGYILDTKIERDDEALYERSIALEPASLSSEKKRFNWFPRS
ncbi:ras guanine nucleotide exchange factor domain-containing protein [Lineolata rhizophorae]|uniref:Ras guanine nucleotide exchange factor domain-containing protein n=1 Tax=Lineolata rhizophorae TaxID=578093 RepID=A0A6A6PAQ4_9PEZI|nr:ras guanine nucleotide exchange factor domain-containing protein [Lineolata rhizophorae]